MELGYNFEREIEYNYKDSKKPFRLMRGVVVSYKQGVKSRPFMIPKGFTSDGCSIPKVFRFLLGCPHTPKYVPASIIHDYILEHPEVVKYNLKTASEVFFSALLKEGVCPVQAVIMFGAVHLWQSVKNYFEEKWI